MQISMDGKKIRFFAFITLLLCLSGAARAAIVEISAMGSYSKDDLPNGYKSVQRRYTGSIDFKFTSVSSLQFEYTESSTTASYPTTIGTLLPTRTTEEIHNQDRIYSFNWVQNLVPSKWIIQPYFLIGGGRMVRRYKDRLPAYNLTVQEFVQDVATGTGGVGLRLFLTHSMALKAEAKTYVPKFHFRQWKESEQLSLGLSWTF
jgi:hypothetical protein